MKQFVVIIALCLQISRLQGADIYVHMMPWFESKATNNGTWGIHWCMECCNPDNTINGLPDLATFYHPEIGPYASGDPTVVDWQVGHMVASGIKGIFLDWPGTTDAYDYPKNLQNGEVIIQGVKDAGLQFAIVYEDNNLNLALVQDKIGQGTLDMEYIQTNYFSSPNYRTLEGNPLLMTFGPIALSNAADWDAIFTPLNPKPTFLTLWQLYSVGGTYCRGEYPWVFSNYLEGLNDFYDYSTVPIKFGVAYPGFQPYYVLGGWPGPEFTIDYTANTFQTTLDLAIANVDIIQICTWNDYGEGTIIEPTVEAGTTFLDIIGRATKTKYTAEDRQEVNDIYYLRKQHANNATMMAELKQRHLNFVHKYDD